MRTTPPARLLLVLAVVAATTAAVAAGAAAAPNSAAAKPSAQPKFTDAKAFDVSKPLSQLVQEAVATAPGEVDEDEDGPAAIDNPWAPTAHYRPRSAPAR